jgi:chaperone modulatory protein CbpM
MKKHQFLAHTRIESSVLEVWLAEGWLLPHQQAGEPAFSEADVARAQLIGDLLRDLGVNHEGVGVILDLIDQLHGVRTTLRSLLSALQAQPPDVRERLGGVLRTPTHAPEDPV